MWELVATAAAGMNAGAGLQAAIGGGPAPGDVSFSRFAGRSRLINLLLTTLSTAAAVATYYDEKRGSLWLYAGVATSLGIPFNLLMLSPPTPILQPAQPRLVDPYYQRPTSRVRSPAPLNTSHLAREQEGIESYPDEAASGDSAFAAAGTGAQEGGGVGVGFGDEGYTPPRAASPDPRRRLMYAKSGVLVSPETYSSSWTRKFWFSACLSCLSCGVMLALLTTRKDAATYTDTPF